MKTVRRWLHSLRWRWHIRRLWPELECRRADRALREMICRHAHFNPEDWF